MVKKKESAKYTINLTLLLIVVGALIILAAVLFFQLTSERSKNSTLEKQSQAVTELITTSPGVKGRSCGILHSQKAVEIIGSNTIEQRFSNQAVDNQVNTQEGGIHWVDSCLYVDTRNSSNYVELFIETFESAQDAENELLHDLPEVSVEEVAAGKYDRLFYSAGAWFALKERLVIKVSASSGSTIDIKQESQSVFDELTTLIN